MTYYQLHTTIFNRIREAKAWPDSGSSTKLQEQLDILFAAVVLLGRSAPAEHLQGTYTEAALSYVTSTSPAQYELPTGMFIERPDFGIVAVTVNNVYRFGLPEFITHRDLLVMYENPFQQETPAVALDIADGHVFVNGATTVGLSYIPAFTAPTTGNYTTEAVPLPDAYSEQLIQLVQTHIEAEQLGDTGRSQLHGLLAELYATAQN